MRRPEKCLCLSLSAIVKQQAFRRKVLNGVSEVRSVSRAAVTYFMQPAVNKDFHNLLWPLPISSTTVP